MLTEQSTRNFDLGHQILIVEDEGTTALHLRLKLEEFGYGVKGVAASGEQALDILEKHRCDLVLMDLRLAGELSGTQTAKLVQERFQIPVVYVTAYSDSATVKAIEEAGHQGFLVKPIQAENLRPTIQLAISRYKSQQQQLEEERKAWEKRCHESQEQLEHFTYAAGHDLKEPLRTARSFIELLVRRSPGKLDEEDLNLLSIASNGLNRMNVLLQDLLEYAQAGLSPGAPIPQTPAGEALKWALDNLRGAVLDSGANVTCDSLPTVWADPSQLAQVFQNLIANSIKYRQPDHRPQIHVGLAGTDREWIFTIHDNGIGFDQQHASRIFAPFKRLHNQVTYPGTGIGLAICKKIVEAHGGRIWAESEREQGSVFSFTLPKNGL